MFRFEWDEKKAATNARKHGVAFEMACTIFLDPNVLTVADTEHSKTEERWFSIGIAANGAVMCAAYLWREDDSEVTRIRLISARHATGPERRQYEEQT